MNYAPDSQQVFSQPKIAQSYYEVRSYSSDSTPPYVNYYARILAEDISFNKHRYVRVTDQSLESKFKSFSKRWREEIGGESSLSRITGNVNYLKVINLGKEVVPLILKELQKEPAPWFVALRVLTEEEKVGRDHPGNFRQIADAWIKWGKDNKYI
jgi:hypothetical protein